jgi:V/A-type H+-transporting ATPase subunit G/H
MVLSLEIIKVIREAEDKAESIKKEAVVQAKQIITNANNEALKIIDEAEDRAESNNRDVLKVAESEGQLLYDNIIEEAAKKCDDILKKADEKIDVAASIILERIVNTSGNS